MQYAIGTKDAATQPYTTSIPKATDAGTYYVWYKVVGDDDHNDTQPECVTTTIKIYKFTVSYDANGGTNAPAAQTKEYGVTLRLSTQKPSRSDNGLHLPKLEQLTHRVEYILRPRRELHGKRIRDALRPVDLREHQKQGHAARAGARGLHLQGLEHPCRRRARSHGRV